MSGIAFDQKDGFIWYDGNLVDWKEAKVHLLTHSLHYGSAVFEGERVYDDNIFELSAHSQRLIESAKLMGYKIPYNCDEIDEACRQVVRANNITDGYVRPIAWRGSEMMGISAQNNTIHLAIAAWEWPNYFSPEDKMKGLRLKTAPWRRPDPKTAPVHSKVAGLYMICTLSKHQVESEGYNDALMLDWRGYVAESTGANIFFLMSDGRIHTPLPDCFLNGITRQTVIKLAEKIGYEVVERHILPDEIGDATEVFLTGTAVEITPVASIDAHKFTPSTCCTALIDEFAKHVRS